MDAGSAPMRARGDGLPLFRDLPGALHLKVVEAETFSSGTMLHVYAPKGWQRGGLDERSSASPCAAGLRRLARSVRSDHVWKSQSGIPICARRARQLPSPGWAVGDGKAVSASGWMRAKIEGELCTSPDR
jgi:hypothetical protein